MARLTASEHLRAVLPWHSWGSGAGGAHQASRLVPPPPPHSFPQGSPPGIGWVSRDPERRLGLLPRESLRSGNHHEGCELPAPGVGFFTLFCLPFHKYEHQRAGGGIFWSRQQDGENISLSPTLLQPPTCPTSKKKKKSSMCTEGKGGKKKGSIFFHNKEKSTGCSPRLQIYFFKQ